MTYFWQANVTGFTSKNKDNTVKSTIRLVPHSVELPVRTPPVNMYMDSSSISSSTPSVHVDDDEQYVPELDEPHLISQVELNDLVRDLLQFNLLGPFTVCTLKPVNHLTYSY